MTYRGTIAERIAWTSGQLSASDVKVLVALWSCGDYETGRNCHMYLSTLVTRSGAALATVKRCLRRLKDPTQPGGPWIVASQRHRHATRYDICLDRLATQPPKEQQMTMHAPAPTDRSEAQNEPLIFFDDDDHGSEAQNEPLPTRSEAQNEPPTYDPDLDLVRTDTHRAREADYKSEAQNEPQATDDLPLIGRPSPPRCAHPYAHAWCEGRLHVPRDLHFEFLDRLDTRPGEAPSAKAGRLIAFYAGVMAEIPATQAIGEDAYKFWRRAFAAAFAGTRSRDDQAGEARARALGPTYESSDSPAAVAKRQRDEDAQRWQEAREADACAALEAMDPATYAALQADAEMEVAKFKPRMSPEVYADTVRLAMVRLLVDRARAARQRRA